MIAEVDGAHAPLTELPQEAVVPEATQLRPGVTRGSLRTVRVEMSVFSISGEGHQSPRPAPFLGAGGARGVGGYYGSVARQGIGLIYPEHPASATTKRLPVKALPELDAAHPINPG